MTVVGRVGNVVGDHIVAGESQLPASLKERERRGREQPARHMVLGDFRWLGCQSCSFLPRARYMGTCEIDTFSAKLASLPQVTLQVRSELRTTCTSTTKEIWPS